MAEVVRLLSLTTGKVVRAVKGELEVSRGDICLIESDLGGDLAEVIDVRSEICQYQRASQEAVKIIRKATEEDKNRLAWLREKEKYAYEFCLERIKAHGLPMKLVAVRYFFEEKKAIFYYTADGRIDFRQLVKDLARELRIRIEMRQIGVRDEAKLVGGLGVCGRIICCFNFMKSFEPVTIQKARRQQIVINPTKISGLCGRLMCCLAFEEESAGRLYSEEIYSEDDYLIED
jgi:cell fate regulator YaaT (PSP1 superfamily)